MTLTLITLNVFLKSNPNIDFLFSKIFHEQYHSLINNHVEIHSVGTFFISKYPKPLVLTEFLC